MKRFNIYLIGFLDKEINREVMFGEILFEDFV